MSFSVLARCQNCNNPVVVKEGKKIKLRTNIVVFEDDSCVVKCPHCKTSLKIPLALKLSETASQRDQKLFVLQKAT
jgi:hypothetical protein